MERIGEFSEFDLSESAVASSSRFIQIISVTHSLALVYFSLAGCLVSMEIAKLEDLLDCLHLRHC